MRRTLLIDAIGAVIEIDGSALTDDAWSAIEHAWSGARAATDATSTPSASVIASGTVNTESMLASLSIDVTLAALEQQAGELLLLHAAGLATEDGRVVVLVGPSGRGKTTASRVLGRHFGYVSDESVGIEADGTVLPYRKPLSVIENKSYLKVQRSPNELGLRPLPGAPLRVAALVLLDRDDSVGVTRVEPIDLAEGLVGLAQQASYLGRQRRPLGTLLAQIAAVGGVHRVTYRDAASLVPHIARLAARDPRRTARSPVSGTSADPSGSPGAATVPRTDFPLRYQRVEVLDAQSLDEDRLALLVRQGDQPTWVVVLDGIAPTIWEATVQPTTLDRLVATTVATHGDPPEVDAATLVAAAVADLVREGLLHASR